MAVRQYSIQFWRTLCSHFLRRSHHCFNKTRMREIKELFGVTPQVVHQIWNHISSDIPSTYKPQHLLYALLFLKVYSTELAHAIIASCDVKSFRKWAWIFVDLIASLPVIEWSDRLIKPKQDNVNVTVDGVDFPIQEPSEFSSSWWSHKENGPGLRYEVGLSIRTGVIVSSHRPFPCGSYPDLKIFRLGMKDMLSENEKVLADEGYRDEKAIRDHQLRRFILSRHETVNKRLKDFAILRNKFRHDLAKHSICFLAVANICQLRFINGEPLFDFLLRLKERLQSIRTDKLDPFTAPLRIIEMSDRAPKLESSPCWLKEAALGLVFEAYGFAGENLLKRDCKGRFDWVGFVAALLVPDLWKASKGWDAWLQKWAESHGHDPSMQAMSRNAVEEAMVRLVVRRTLELVRAEEVISGKVSWNQVHRHGNMAATRQNNCEGGLPTVRHVLRLALQKHELMRIAVALRNSRLMEGIQSDLEPVHLLALDFYTKMPVQRNAVKPSLLQSIDVCATKLQDRQKKIDNYTAHTKRLFLRDLERPSPDNVDAWVRDLFTQQWRWLPLAMAVHRKQVVVEEMASALLQASGALTNERLLAFYACLDGYVQALADKQQGPLWLPRSDPYGPIRFSRPKQLAEEQVTVDGMVYFPETIWPR